MDPELFVLIVFLFVLIIVFVNLQTQKVIKTKIKEDEINRHQELINAINNVNKRFVK